MEKEMLYHTHALSIWSAQDKKIVRKVVKKMKKTNNIPQTNLLSVETINLNFHVLFKSRM